MSLTNDTSGKVLDTFQATSGSCPVDCQLVFYLFLAVISGIYFIVATGRASNFLVGIRCVNEVDKTASVAMGITIIGVFAFIPSPLLFGSIIGEYLMKTVLLNRLIRIFWGFQTALVLFGEKLVRELEIAGCMILDCSGIP